MRIGIKNKLLHFTLILCFLFLLSSLAVTQTIKGFYKYERSSTEVENFLKSLEDKDKIKTIPKDFFTEVYDCTLPDLIFFINREDEKKTYTNILLVKNGEGEDRLFGERYIYVMVFVAENEKTEESVKEKIKFYTKNEREITEHLNDQESKLKIKTKEKYVEAFPLSVKHASLKRMPGTGDFAFLSLAKGIASSFTGSIAAGEEAAEKEKEIPLPLEMSEVGCNNGTRLTFGMVKIRLTHNSINRITILGFPDIIPLATFGNYSGSWLTSSAASLITPLKSKTVKREEINKWQGNAFLLCHFYIKRPQMPYLRSRGKSGFEVLKDKTSLSVVVGTKLSEDFFKFNDVFLGVCLGHSLYNNLGIIVGLNLRTPNFPEPDPEAVGNDTQETWSSKRECQFAFGFTYIF